MQEFIVANMISQDNARDIQRAHDEQFNPDQLYRYERWASTHRGPGLMSKTIAIVRHLVINRSARQKAGGKEVSAQVGSQCLPQT